MNWSSLLSALPALGELIFRLFGKKETPPKRASEILPDEPEMTKAEREARQRIKDRFGTN